MKTIQNYSLTVKILACLLFASAVAADPIIYDLPPNLKAPGGIAQGGDGNFYGAAEYTEVAGVRGDGAIFEMAPDGISTTVATLNGANGSVPTAMFGQASFNGHVGVWGTTAAGGPEGVGTIFVLGYDSSLTTIAPFHVTSAGGGFNGTQFA